MRFDRIVLFVLGNGTDDTQTYSQALQSEIYNRISCTCDNGSVYGACFASFNGTEFSTTVNSAVHSVQADSRLPAFGIAADAVNCVFVVNNALTAEQWKRCFTMTRRSVESIVTKVSYFAIVQRDGIADSETMAAALAEANMAVYCFQQQTERGYIIASETDEKQMMAYYALLAGAGELNVERGMYTGSFNKLSLMAEDFHRIRNYYVIRGLVDTSNRDKISEDILFSAFFGSWVGAAVNTTASVELLCSCMRGKLVSAFPSPEELAILANKEEAITRENIKRFIEINFENDRRFGKFADRIITGNNKDTGKPSIIQSWENSVDDALDRNPVYYCEEVCDYIHNTLIPWLRKSAMYIEKGTSHVENLGADILGGKEFIENAIAKAQRSMERYMDRITVRILNEIAEKLDEKANAIREMVQANIDLFEKKQWLLDDADLADFNHYARNIIELIASYCKANNLPQSAMTSASDYFGKNVEANWETLVDSQNKRIQNHFKDAADLISQLQNDDAATFRSDIPNLLKDRGFRLNYGASTVQPAAGTPRTIYIIPDNLGVGINGKDFPEAAVGNCKQIGVHGFDNVLQFRIARLATSSTQEPPDSANFRKTIFESLPYSTRYVRHIERGEISRPVEIDHGEKKAGPIIITSDGKAIAERKGNSLEVTLPSGVSGEIRWSIEGYSSSGTIKSPVKATRSVGSARNVSIPLNDFYGRCKIVITNRVGEKLLEMEFDGPRTKAAMCKQSRPLLKKSQKVQLVTGVITVEHHIFKLVDKEAPELEACINPSGINNDEAFRYPIGGGREWHVWVGETFADTMKIEACDREGIRQLECQ